MRNVVIGDRQIDSMTEDEFAEFIYREGYCASKEYWKKPVITRFEFDRNPSDSPLSLYFTFFQERIEDGDVKERSGIFSFGGDEVSLFMKVHTFPEKYDHYRLGTSRINTLIKMGFDIPIYGLETL